ncbi:MAG: hypothetical protein KKD63_01775, partial [Proteobacteria bacterium]|nr:hypothetical protein [Pseudomonadota bacterium]
AGSKGLREELIEYRQSNITPNFSDQARCILRDELLERLIILKPTTKDEFYKTVSLELREQTDGKQMQYLEDIFEIIDAYA